MSNTALTTARAQARARCHACVGLGLACGGVCTAWPALAGQPGFAHKGLEQVGSQCG